MAPSRGLSPCCHAQVVLADMLVVGALTEQLITLVVGFALTTIVGGLLGAYLQRRTWNHQTNARSRSPIAAIPRKRVENSASSWTSGSIACDVLVLT
jgi:hypothetical protein